MVARGTRLDVAEVVAGAERAAGPGQHQHADRLVALDAIENLQERREVFRLQPVEVPRPIEPDGRARPLDREDRGRALAALVFGRVLLVLDQAASSVVDFAASSRSCRRRILPTLVFGSSSRNSTYLGFL